MKNNKKVAAAMLATAVLVLTGVVSAQQSAAARSSWTTFKVGHVQVQTPVELVDKWHDKDDDFGLYSGVAKGTYYYVFRDSADKPHGTKVVVKFVGSAGEKLPPDGKTLSFKDQFGYYNDLVVYHAAGRIYIAQAVSAKDDDPDARRFISSFALQSGAAAAEAKPVVPDETTEAAEAVPLPLPVVAGSEDRGAGTGSGRGYGIGSGGGMGSGIGKGSGSGVGSRSVESSPQLPKTTSALNLLAKPRPGYTDLARFYDINGTVILRVTFLGSGKVGTVTPVTRLPFGLTEQAIAAANRITFEPKVTNGTPQSVTKQVEYSFLIY
jgi:hypothetical protein